MAIYRVEYDVRSYPTSYVTYAIGYDYSDGLQGGRDIVCRVNNP